MRNLWVNDMFIQLYNPQHDPSERKAMGTQNKKLTRLIIDTDSDKREWFIAVCHVSDVHNHTASEKLGWETPIEVRFGYTRDATLLT